MMSVVFRHLLVCAPQSRTGLSRVVSGSRQKWQLFFATTMCLFLLAGCGGGSGDSPTADNNLPQSDPTESDQSQSDEDQDQTNQDSELNNGEVVGADNVNNDADQSEISDVSTVDGDIGTIPEIGDETEDSTNEQSNSETSVDDENNMDGSANEVPQDLSLDENRAIRWSQALNVEEFTAENYQAILTTVAEVVRFDYLVELAQLLEDLELQLSQNAQGFELISLTEGIYDRVHLCPDGGRVLAQVPEQDPNSATYTRNYSFRECQFGDLAIAGNVIASESTVFINENPVQQLSYLFAGFGFERDDGYAIGGAGASVTYEYSDDGDRYVAAGAGFIELKAPGIEDGLIVNSTLMTYEANASELLIRSDENLGRRVAISLIVDDLIVNTNGFEDAFQSEKPDTNYVIGQMNMAIGNNNRLVVQAANGDENTFDVFNFTGANQIESFVVDWGPQFEFSAPARVQR